MTKEDKELLLKDLCSRLPYGVKCHFKYGTSEGDIILKCIDGNIARFDHGWYGKFHVVIDPQYIKPYLRPMSSMTEEEKEEEGELWDIVTKTRNDLHYLYTDFLLSHHFDYRGLIKNGLALEASKDMYK